MNFPPIAKQLIKKLHLPKPNSHKRDNGRLLIIAGSNKYFGALVYCIKTAARLVDLIYLLATPENQKLVKLLKIKTSEFMPVEKFPDAKLLSDIDCILVGPGMGISKKTKQLTRQVLMSGKKAVVDADALKVLDTKLKKLLNNRHILTPHTREFQRLFHLPASPQNAKKMSRKYHCNIVLKGPVDIVANPGKALYYNYTGNAGMTKAGTGDILAGLIAGFYATNDAYTSAAAGVYINGSAGDALYKKVGTFYNAGDLAEQLPKTLNYLSYL